MYPVTLGLPFCVQETTLDANFTGANEYGRAKATLGAPGSQVFIAAKLYGTGGNGYTVTLVNTGATTAATYVRQTGYTIEVYLRRSSVAMLATPEEVATAINAANLAVRATWAGTTVMSSGTAPLVGGTAATRTDPTASRFEWERTTGQTGGFFYFENTTEVLIVTGIKAKFSGLGVAIPLTFEVVNLDEGTKVVTSSAFPVLRAEVSAAVPDFSLVGQDGIPLLPYQALRVVCAAIGSVQVTAQRLARHPYA